MSDMHRSTSFCRLKQIDIAAVVAAPVESPQRKMGLRDSVRTFWLSFRQRFSTHGPQLKLALAIALGVLVCIVGYLLYPELYLRTWSMESADAFWKANVHRSDIIVSLTTVPKRVDALDTVLKSLMLQTFAPKGIYLYVPQYSQRDKTPYVIPARFRSLLSVSIKQIDKDWGPATKFLPAVLTLPDDQLVMSVDDDVIYPYDFIERLHSMSRLHPNSVLGTRGWDVPRSLKWAESGTLFGTALEAGKVVSVDVITGCGGILFKPRFFDKTALAALDSVPREAFFVDDIWISGNLAKKQVPRLVIPVKARHKTQFLRYAINKRSSLINRENAGGHNNDVMLRWFREYWRYES